MASGQTAYAGTGQATGRVALGMGRRGEGRAQGDWRTVPLEVFASLVRDAASKAVMLGQGATSKASVVGTGRALGVRDASDLGTLKGRLVACHVKGLVRLGAWDVFDGSDVACREMSAVVVGAGAVFYTVLASV